MFGALLPILQGLVALKGAGSVFSLLTLSQWISLADSVATAEPEIKKALVALHPALEKLMTDLEAGFDANEAAGRAHQFAHTPASTDWLAPSTDKVDYAGRPI